MDGKQLKAVRIDAGMTQTEFARAIGYSAPYVCNMENGHDENTPVLVRSRKLSSVGPG